MIRRLFDRLRGRQVLRVGDMLIVRPRGRWYVWTTMPAPDYMGTADDDYVRQVGEWYLRGDDR